ncbi:sigma 54-interacting transcriptional regulator [Rubrivirga sp. S365]|uniref:sigma 54-interacting transcriptional regulator n=1 Tax=Rubrivirga sp. S365 TaxID=3076080 RepID=UPI0028C67025|nr:sigma 54-interacting transcriptional regulator [Rubrivirga sp. S365]MDT7855818.1 sigma 54-interacting transcriptional regulator [Rubrivirga sp. S365]
MTDAPDISTLGALKESGYHPRSVKDEVRANLVQRLKAGDDVFPGILGFDRTVIPQVQNALLGRHDFILLGLRGQAKSRIVRMLPSLLDEWVPEVEGSEIHDDPLAPVSKYARDLVAERGDETPVTWLHRSARYGEKLATPDTSIADLIGDIDPIKAATRKLTYADEEVIHFGIIPRTHRGIFAINELPDLQPRIQVGLLNIMEEQDIQIRGFNVRIPIDVLMVFTANPEDYTNRGSIITPLKDRIDSQILTHYPRELGIGVEITRQEAWDDRAGGDGAPETPAVHIPHVFREIIEQVAFEARASEYVDQKSGVSARLTRAALEDLVSAAERRALLNGEAETTARASDLESVEPAVTGKVELVYEGEQEGAQEVARALVGRAVAAIMKTYLPDPAEKGSGESGGRAAYSEVLGWFSKGNAVDLDGDLPFADYAKALDRVDGLGKLVDAHTQPSSPAEKASVMELALEMLHQHSLVGKEVADDGASYADMMGSVLSGLGSYDDDDFDDDDDEYRRFN